MTLARKRGGKKTKRKKNKEKEKTTKKKNLTRQHRIKGGDGRS
jgi:hypothetical protein